MAAGLTSCEYVSFIKPGISRRGEKVLKIYSYLLFKKKQQKNRSFFFSGFVKFTIFFLLFILF